MAFHEINLSSRFGREYQRMSVNLFSAKQLIALNLARVEECADDAQARSITGFSVLTKAQIISTLTAALTRLTDASIDAIIEQIG